MRCAAIFVAHFICVGMVGAQEVTFQSPDNAVSVTGRFVAFDGAIATVISDGAPVSFRAEDMICEGRGCPDLATYAPTLRLTGAAQMGDVLLPPLIEVYARDNGWRTVEDTQGFDLVDDTGATVFTIVLDVQSHEDGFARFVDHRADGFLSMRDLRSAELERAEDAGLGRLNIARQARILALDALVPVVSPSLGRTTISLSELTAALAGQSDAFEVHRAVGAAGQIAGFEDRFMRPFQLRIGGEVTEHASVADLTSAIASGSNGLSLVPSGQTGNTQRLALTGPCGLESDARFLNMKTEDYPLTFPLFIYLPQRNQHPQIVDFLDWLRSPSAQLVIRRAGFVDLAAVPIPIANQGERLAGAVLNAGAEVPLIELQRMMRILTPRVRMSSTFRFEPGSTRLDGQSRSNVMQLAQAIRDGRFATRELMFVGFSDGRGPAVANRDLSAARAEAVRRDVERALGGNIPANVRIETEAFGEALPMACDDTIWGQQTNRRVELWVRDAG